MRRDRIVVACAVLSGVVACGGDPPEPEVCTTSADCQEPLECGDGVCVPPDLGETDGRGGEGGCRPPCAVGAHCENASCVPDYTIRFVDPARKAGRAVTLVLEVRPTPGIPPMTAERIGIEASLNAIEWSPPPELRPVEGHDNRWEIELALSSFPIPPPTEDNLLLRVEATLRGLEAIAPVVTQLYLDNRPPELAVYAVDKNEFLRSEPVTFSVLVTELNARGLRAFASLVGEGQQPPGPAPMGWTEGTPASGSSLFSFTIDQRDPLAIPKVEPGSGGWTGTLDVFLWASDEYGNAAEKVEANRIRVTRRAWGAPGDLSGPVLGAPVVLDDGRVAVLVDTSSSGAVAVFDAGGDRTVLNVPSLATPPGSLSVGRDGALYVPTSSTLSRYTIAGNQLVDPPTLRCPASAPSGPALGEVDGMEVAFVTVANAGGGVAMCAGSTAPAVQGNLGASPNGIGPIVTEDDAGRTIVLVGGQSSTQVPDATLTLYRPETIDALPRIGALSSDRFDVLRDAGLALDGATVVTAPRFRTFVTALTFDDGWEEAPIEGTPFGFTNLDPATRSIGYGIVSRNAVIFPTRAGIRALPRSAPWSSAVSFVPELAGDQEFVAAPVAGEGDVIYAVNTRGTLHALRYVEGPGAPELKLLWHTELGNGMERFTAALTLTCDGLLVAGSDNGSSSGRVHALLTDSRGLDPHAPWPKFQHDVRNTGNTITPIRCD